MDMGELVCVLLVTFVCVVAALALGLGCFIGWLVF